MKRITLLTLAMCLLCFVSCSDSEDYAKTTEVAEAMKINGDCDVYSLANTESATWSIVESPGWITPVSLNGDATEEIKLYVESNSRAERNGVVTVKYSNGKIISTNVTQTTEQTSKLFQKSYAIGWGLDITTYMDSRGLKDQILNTQKVIKTLGEEYIQYENSKSSEQIIFYGEDYESLSDNINAQFAGDVKVAAFELGLKGQFGNKALKDSKRFFSWMRGTFVECVANIDNIQPSDAYDNFLLTYDFTEQYDEVVDSKGSDESIRNLISRYGTHIVTASFLGGYLDYYYSSSIDKVESGQDIEGALKFGYNNMFKIEGGGDYEEKFNELKSEMIEKFVVKGGNAIDLTNKIVSGAMKNEGDSEKKQSFLDEWRNSLQSTDAKLELVDFEIAPISILFPPKIGRAIDNYITRVLYYENVNITRSITDNK